MEKYYIGLATTYHDPALAILDSQGEVIFAEATERFLQNKRAIGIPADERSNFRRILKEHCDPKAEFIVAKPWSAKLERFMDFMSLIRATDMTKLPSRNRKKMTRFLVEESVLFGNLWIQQALFKTAGGHIADLLSQEHDNGKVSYRKFDHHCAHAANACFTSPFAHAACMVVDGQGEWGSISYFEYKDARLREVHRMKGKESLGILYSIITIFCGFEPEKGEEWKVMGLAPYGKVNEEILALLRSLVAVEGLSIKYPDVRGVERWFEKMKPYRRKPGQPALEVADLAHTMQAFYAETMTQLLNSFYALGLSENLVLGGGCALNSAFNGEITQRSGFKKLHIPSAPGDDGNALGAAFLAFHEDHPERPAPARTLSPYLGSSLSRVALENFARFSRLPKLRHLPGEICKETARILAEGKLVGWVQNRAEFGPRALGARSILADPRPADMKEKINALVKFREEFRPFAPSVLEENGEEYFEHYQPSPYMDRTLTFKESAREKVPAIVHVNATGRLQSVRRDWNPRYHELIREFNELTGVPMLLNTSFNIMGKPIIHTVEDALGLFYTAGLDALVMEDYLLEK